MYEASIENLRGLFELNTSIVSIEITKEHIITTDIFGAKEYANNSVELIEIFENKKK